MPPTHLEEVHSVEDTTIPGAASQLPVRIYKPHTSPGEHLAAMIYFHGGGFIIGGIQSHDSVCRALAKKVPCIIVSVEYRWLPKYCSVMRVLNAQGTCM
jgi:acetyl esterase